jgi:hypothetical protein
LTHRDTSALSIAALRKVHSITSSAATSSVCGTRGAEGLAGFEIDEQFNFGRLLDGQIGPPGAFYRSGVFLIRWNFIRVVREIGMNLRKRRITYKW